MINSSSFPSPGASNSLVNESRVEACRQAGRLEVLERISEGWRIGGIIVAVERCLEVLERISEGRRIGGIIAAVEHLKIRLIHISGV